MEHPLLWATCANASERKKKIVHICIILHCQELQTNLSVLPLLSSYVIIHITLHDTEYMQITAQEMHYIQQQYKVPLPCRWSGFVLRELQEALIVIGWAGNASLLKPILIPQIEIVLQSTLLNKELAFLLL